MHNFTSNLYTYGLSQRISEEQLESADVFSSFGTILGSLDAVKNRIVAIHIQRWSVEMLFDSLVEFWSLWIA